MEIKEIKEFSDLLMYLREWKNFEKGEDYDLRGVLGLLKALLANLNKNSIEVDYEDVEDYFEESEIVILKKLIDIN